MNNIPMEPVQSSNIRAIGFRTEDTIDNQEIGTLSVEFNSGRTYHYFDVPEDVYLSLTNAASVGSAFATLVRKGGYRYEQVG